MGKSNNRIIVNSEAFHFFLCKFDYFIDEERIQVSDGLFSILRAAKATPTFMVEAMQEFEIFVEGKKLKRLRKILKHVPEQPVCIRFDSHIEIEGITI